MKPFSLLIQFVIFLPCALLTAGLDAPDACVTVFVYDDEKCTGEPKREMTFPTWSKPGSPCFRSQWCNRSTGNWHEILYVGNEQCKESWFAKAVDLTFTTDSCIGGMQLKECQFHKCGEDNSLVPINHIVKVKTMLRGNEIKA